MAYATVEDFDRFGIRSSALPDSITPDDKLAAIRAASGLSPPGSGTPRITGITGTQGPPR
jgi:hypothetical protein